MWNFFDLVGKPIFLGMQCVDIWGTQRKNVGILMLKLYILCILICIRNISEWHI